MSGMTYYEKNRDVILNRAKDYYENDKERLREKARDKYRNLSEEDKNMEKTNTPFFLYKHNDYKHIEAEIS